MIMTAWWQWLGVVLFMLVLLTLIYCVYERKVEEDEL